MFYDSAEAGDQTVVPLLLRCQFFLASHTPLNDTAKIHDSQHIDDLTADEQHSVFADSAYMSSDRKKDLESRGVFCGIIQRRVRGQKELTTEQKWHNRLVAGIRAVVEHPFAWMKNTGYRRARYRGLNRNGMDFALHAVAYNFKRSFSLQEAVA